MIEELLEAVTRVKVWQCVGCGRIDHPQPCVGVCRDQKAEYVLAREHDDVVACLRERIEALEGFARTLAVTTPHEGEAQRTWRALQRKARELLAEDQP